MHPAPPMPEHRMNDYPNLPHPEHDAAFYDGVLARRLVAWFVDLIIITLLSMVVIIGVGIVTLGIGFFAAPFLMLATAFAYRVITITGRSGTWGMAFMGIEFRTKDGDTFDLTHAALHTLIFFALMASMIGWVASIIAMLSTQRGQGLGDLLLGTVAINKAAE